MGIKIHSIPCNNANHDFYNKIAEITGGTKIPLKKFDDITKLILAICFKEG